jgi:hypothetical protein
MQAMLDEVVTKLKSGVRMLSETVRANAREGDIGMQLGEIAKANPEVAIGSYPFFDPQHEPNTNVALRARDAQKLAQAKREIEAGASAASTIKIVPEPLLDLSIRLRIWGSGVRISFGRAKISITRPYRRSSEAALSALCPHRDGDSIPGAGDSEMVRRCA